MHKIKLCSLTRLVICWKLALPLYPFHFMNSLIKPPSVWCLRCVYMKCAPRTHTTHILYIIVPNLIKLTHFRQWYPFKTVSSKEEEKIENTMPPKHRTSNDVSLERVSLSLSSSFSNTFTKWKTTAVFGCRGNNLAECWKTYEFRQYFPKNVLFAT